jgi:hypothetical protein
MAGVISMTDTEFAAMLRSVPRELTPEESDVRERRRDAERGAYVSPTETTHHCGESAH